MNCFLVLAFIAPLVLYRTAVDAHHHGDPNSRPGFNGHGSMGNAGVGAPPEHHPFGVCSHSPRHRHPELPDFLKNVSSDGVKEFCNIVHNENLTKVESEQQLEQWAQNQGVQEQFKKFVDEKKQKLNDIQQKMQELIANITQFISEMEAIHGDTKLTKREEREKVFDLVNATERIVVALAKKIRAEAGFLSGEHGRKPCPKCGPHRSHVPHGHSSGLRVPRRAPRFPGGGNGPFGQNGNSQQSGPFLQNGSLAQGGPSGPNGNPPQGWPSGQNGNPPQGGPFGPNGNPPQGWPSGQNGNPPQGGPFGPNGNPPQGWPSGQNGNPPQGGPFGPNGNPPQGWPSGQNGNPPQGDLSDRMEILHKDGPLDKTELPHKADLLGKTGFLDINGPVLECEEAHHNSRLIAVDDLEEAAMELLSKAGIFHKADHSDKTELLHGVGLLDKTELLHRVDLSDKTELPHQVDLSDKTELPHRVDLSDKTELPHRVDLSDKTELPHRVDLLDKMEILGNS